MNPRCLTEMSSGTVVKSAMECYRKRILRGWGKKEKWIGSHLPSEPFQMIEGDSFSVNNKVPRLNGFNFAETMHWVFSCAESHLTCTGHQYATNRSCLKGTSTVAAKNLKCIFFSLEKELSPLWPLFLWNNKVFFSELFNTGTAFQTKVYRTGIWRVDSHLSACKKHYWNYFHGDWSLERCLSG